jgi:MFS family permease
LSFPPHRLVRRLLVLDQPHPALSDAEVAAEIEQHYRWNFLVNLLDVATFWFGFSLISATTIVPLYIRQLSDSQLPIGIVAVVAQASWFLPQLFTANVVERLPRKKPVIMWFGLLLERLPMLLMVLSAVIATRRPTVALVVFLIGFAWRGFGSGITATSWQDLIARCFPVTRRGRFMGLSLFAGTLAGTGAAALSAWLLESFPFSRNFAYNFGIATLFLMLSWAFISMTREPRVPARATRRTSREFVAELPEIMRRDHNFRHFLLARTLLAFGALGTGFVTVAAIDRWAVPNSTVGLYTAALLIGQAVATPTFGLLSDRFGHKVTLEMGALAAVGAFALAWLAPSPVWYFVVFALLGIQNGAIVVAGILVIMEFARAEKRPTYAGLANTAVGIASVAAPLVGAGLAVAGYGWLFAISAVITLASWVLLHFWVREPRYAPAADVPV